MPLTNDLQAAGQPSARLRNNTKTQHENNHSCSSESCGSSARAEYLALAARATNDAVRDWDVGSGKLCWPEGLENLLGYKPAAVPEEIGFWQKQIHPEDRARTAASIRTALAEADTWSGEYRFRCADGVYVHLLERATIVRSDDDSVRFVGSLMDITARKQLQDQLLRSQKMDAFGQLAGGVAHDFNNFLTTILGYSDLLLDENGLIGANAKHVGEIRSAAKRASALTSQLLAFSRKQSLEPRTVEVNTFINHLERSLLRLLGDNITVECHLHRSSDPAHIRVDAAQLTQIILNLAVNARDAMPSGGRLTIGTATVRIDKKTQPTGCTDALPDGEYALISITDDGTGMTDEVKARLFEPFFTTKDEGRGSGLGLATSYGIVRQSGGHICVDSHVGKGTMVSIYLPKFTAPPAPTYQKPGMKKLATGTETVLVVEDDVSVRHISVRVLRALGYDVIEAASGDDAQRIITFERQKKIDLLLTDMVMPQMSGRDFADWLVVTSPDTKVIFVSGYLDEALMAGERCTAETFFLPKPFDPEQLATKVRQALDS